MPLSALASAICPNLAAAAARDSDVMVQQNKKKVARFYYRPTMLTCGCCETVFPCVFHLFCKLTCKKKGDITTYYRLSKARRCALGTFF